LRGERNQEENQINNLNDNISILNLVPLAHREVQVGVFSKVSLALMIFGVSIFLSMTGILPTTLSFVGAILLYVFTDIFLEQVKYQ
jgi:flagellar biosynthesis protein FliQ